MMIFQPRSRSPQSSSIIRQNCHSGNVPRTIRRMAVASPCSRIRNGDISDFPNPSLSHPPSSVVPPKTYIRSEHLGTENARESFIALTGPQGLSEGRKSGQGEREGAGEKTWVPYG